jgi:hypothetical protein
LVYAPTGRHSAASAAASPRRPFAPLGLEFYIGVLDTVVDERLALLVSSNLWQRLTGMPPLTLDHHNTG